MRSHLNNDLLVQCDLIRHLLRKCHLLQRGRLWEPRGNRPPSSGGKAMCIRASQCPPKRLPLWGNSQHPLMLTDEVAFVQRFACTVRPHPSFAPQMPPSPEGKAFGEPHGNRPPFAEGKALGTTRQQATFRRGEGYYGFRNDAPATAPSSGGLPGRHSRPHRETRFARGMSMAAWKAAATGLTISSIADPYPWLEGRRYRFDHIPHCRFLSVAGGRRYRFDHILHCRFLSMAGRPPLQV